MTVALLVAAGGGLRLGAERPKAFVLLGGRPMLEWSIEALRAGGAQQIVVALPEGEHAPAGCHGVRGGVTRSHSVRAALAAAAAAERVLVHDAARPLLEPELVRRTLAALEHDGGADAAIAAAPVTDTVKRADGARTVLETLPRAGLWAIQTPQAFRRRALERALAVGDDVLAAATDDAWLVERAGGSVRVVESSPRNLKVTTPFDLRVAELLLAERC